MDDGGNKSEFELEVNDKDVELVSADIESPGEDDIELPADDTELTEGDISEPVDPDEEPKKPEDKPAEEEKPADEPSDDELDAELDSELDELEAEEKEETSAEEEKAEKASEETTSADEEKPEEEPAEEEKADEEPTEEEKPEDEVAEEAPVEDAPADEEKPEEEAPAEEEKPEEEKTEDEATEEASAEEEKPEEAPIVVEGENAPVDSTAANSTFPVEPAKETKDNKSKIGLFVMITIIVLLLIGCGIFALMGGAKPAKENNNSSKTKDQEKTETVLASELNIKLLKDWTSGNKNEIFSPLSIKYLLAMLSDASAGDTKQEILNLIGDNYTPAKYADSKNRVIANAIFVRDDYKEAIKASYLDTIKTKYNANAIYDPFNNASSLNDWVYKNTLSLIPKIMEDEDVQALDFILINALAIDMRWENTFQCAYTGKDDGNKCISYYVDYAHEKYGDSIRPYEGGEKYQFGSYSNAHGLAVKSTLNNYDIINEIGEDKIRETVKEAFDKWKSTASETDLKDMEKSGYGDFDTYFKDYIKQLGANYGDVKYSTDYSMYVDDEVKVFAKDLREYDGARLQYIGIMPRLTDLKGYVKDLSTEKLNNTISKLKEIKSENFDQGKVYKINGYLPAYKYDTNYDLKEELEENLGVKAIFSEKGDITPMIEVEGAQFTNAVHAAMIDFSNEGIKAAAVSVAGGMGAAGEPFDYLWDVPIEEIDLTFDKPFMYLIRDKATGEVWFMGSVYEPKTI